MVEDTMIDFSKFEPKKEILMDLIEDFGLTNTVENQRLVYLNYIVHLYEKTVYEVHTSYEFVPLRKYNLPRIFWEKYRDYLRNKLSHDEFTAALEQLPFYTRIEQLCDFEPSPIPHRELTVLNSIVQTVTFCTQITSRNVTAIQLQYNLDSDLHCTDYDLYQLNNIHASHFWSQRNDIKRVILDDILFVVYKNILINVDVERHLYLLRVLMYRLRSIVEPLSYSKFFEFYILAGESQKDYDKAFQSI